MSQEGFTLSHHDSGYPDKRTHTHLPQMQHVVSYILQYCKMSFYHFYFMYVTTFRDHSRTLTLFANLIEILTLKRHPPTNHELTFLLANPTR